MLLNFGIEGTDYVMTDDGKLDRPKGYDETTDALGSNFWGGRMDEFEPDRVTDAPNKQEIYDELDAVGEGLPVHDPHGEQERDRPLPGGYRRRALRVHPAAPVRQVRRPGRRHRGHARGSWRPRATTKRGTPSRQTWTPGRRPRASRSGPVAFRRSLGGRACRDPGLDKLDHRRQARPPAGAGPARTDVPTDRQGDREQNLPPGLTAPAVPGQGRGRDDPQPLVHRDVDPGRHARCRADRPELHRHEDRVRREPVRGGRLSQVVPDELQAGDAPGAGRRVPRPGPGGLVRGRRQPRRPRHRADRPAGGVLPARLPVRAGDAVRLPVQRDVREQRPGGAEQLAPDVAPAPLRVPGRRSRSPPSPSSSPSSTRGWRCTGCSGSSSGSPGSPS